MHRSTPVVLALSVIAASLVSFGASAADIDRRSYQNGGSACTGALPTFEGALRKRPLAIVNEGTSNAFITCSTIADELNASRPTFGYMRLVNLGGADATVNCTMINGAEWEGSLATPETRTIAAGTSTTIIWGSTASDAPQLPLRTINFSCGLPPGVGVSYVGKQFKESNGVL